MADPDSLKTGTDLTSPNSPHTERQDLMAAMLHSIAKTAVAQLNTVALPASGTIELRQLGVSVRHGITRSQLVDYWTIDIGEHSTFAVTRTGLFVTIDGLPPAGVMRGQIVPRKFVHHVNAYFRLQCITLNYLCYVYPHLQAIAQDVVACMIWDPAFDDVLCDVVFGISKSELLRRLGLDPQQ